MLYPSLVYRPQFEGRLMCNYILFIINGAVGKAEASSGLRHVPERAGRGLDSRADLVGSICNGLADRQSRHWRQEALRRVDHRGYLHAHRDVVCLGL